MAHTFLALAKQKQAILVILGSTSVLRHLHLWHSKTHEHSYVLSTATCPALVTKIVAVWAHIASQCRPHKTHTVFMHNFPHKVSAEIFDARCTCQLVQHANSVVGSYLHGLHKFTPRSCAYAERSNKSGVLDSFQTASINWNIYQAKNVQAIQYFM